MRKQPLTVTINLIIILINALIWLALGIIIAFNLHPGLPDLPGIKLGLTIISFVIFGMLLGLTFLLRKHNRTGYYLSLAFFIGTSIVTFFDDVGISDVVFLIISLIPVIFLIVDRKWYLQSMPKTEEDI
jgi:hypothetical protein